MENWKNRHSSVLTFLPRFLFSPTQRRPEFRPFSILFVIAIGFLWDRPAGQQVVAPSATAGSPLAELGAKVWALRTTRPLSMVAGSVAGCLTYTYLVCYVLPLWLSLGVAGLVVCWDRFGVPGGPLSIAPSK